MQKLVEQIKYRIDHTVGDFRTVHVAAAKRGLGTIMHPDTFIQSPYDVLPLESILDPDDVNVNVYRNRLRSADHTAETPEEY